MLSEVRVEFAAAAIIGSCGAVGAVSSHDGGIFFFFSSADAYETSAQIFYFNNCG